jgi:MFS family permease
MRPYIELLRRPGAANILLAHGLGRFSPGMILIALILALRQAGYPYAAVGLVIGAHQLSVAVGSPLQGRLADVLGHRRILFPDGVAYFAGTAVLSLGIGRSWGVLGLVLAALMTGVVSPPLTACTRAAYGAMFTGRDRERAYILTASNIEVGFLLGPLLAVAIATTVGGRFAVIAAGSGVLLGATIYAVGSNAEATGPRERKDAVSLWSGGMFSALHSPGMRAMALVYLGIGANFGFFDIFSAAVSESAGRPGFAGLLISTIAGSSLVGGFFYGSRVWTGTLRERMRRLTLMLATANLLLSAVAGDLRLVAGAAVVAGVLIGPMNVCGFQIVYDVAPVESRTEAQSWMQAAIYLGSAIGGAVGGAVVEIAGPRSVALFAALGLLASATMLGRSLAIERPREDREIPS